MVRLLCDWRLMSLVGLATRRAACLRAPAWLRFAAVLSLLWGALKAREKHPELAFKSLQSLGGGK